MSLRRQFVVYAIIDPRDSAVFYVGQTGDFERRCAEHREGTDQLSGLVIKQLKENGFIPHFVVLETCANEAQSLMAEIFWMELFVARGARLMNRQNFNGHADWRDERRAKSETFEKMLKAKMDDAQGLRDLANGRVHAGSKKPPRRWTKRDESRLAGMHARRMSLGDMARLLSRSQRSVELKLEKMGLSAA